MHFNEQLRQLEEISGTSEQFLPPVKLTLLQNAVRGINDFRIAETMMSSNPFLLGMENLPI